LKIVAVTNTKGGVGKTTTAVNLAYLSAAGGRATVLWDLDPQGAAPYTLKCEPSERTSVKKLLAGKRELPELGESRCMPRSLPAPASSSR
jgi:chromosome partitioning protein